MRAFLRAVLLIPLAVLLLGFALANREVIVVHFDPLGFFESPLAYDVPLFLPIFVAAAVGILIGGFATWLSQGRHRQAARYHRREVERQRRENEELRREKALPPLPPATMIG